MSRLGSAGFLRSFMRWWSDSSWGRSTIAGCSRWCLRSKVCPLSQAGCNSSGLISVPPPCTAVSSAPSQAWCSWSSHIFYIGIGFPWKSVPRDWDRIYKVSFGLKLRLCKITLPAFYCSKVKPMYQTLAGNINPLKYFSVSENLCFLVI